jgi:hypothetical protein
MLLFKLVVWVHAKLEEPTEAEASYKVEGRKEVHHPFCRIAKYAMQREIQSNTAAARVPLLPLLFSAATWQ